MISQFRANTFFMGAYSVHPEFGVTDPYVLAAGIKRKMIQSATRTILVADYTKFGKTSKSVVCSLDQVDRVITDDKVDGEGYCLIPQKRTTPSVGLCKLPVPFRC